MSAGEPAWVCEPTVSDDPAPDESQPAKPLAKGASKWFVVVHVSAPPSPVPPSPLCDPAPASSAVDEPLPVPKAVHPISTHEHAIADAQPPRIRPRLAGVLRAYLHWLSMQSCPAWQSDIDVHEAFASDCVRQTPSFAQ